MKAPKGIEDMAARLRTAATTPALTVVQVSEAPPPAIKVRAPKAPKPSKEAPAKRVKGAGASVSVFLRVPQDKHADLEAEAVRRTKESGKGVTVQQIILERL